MKEVDIIQKNDSSMNKTVNFRKLLGAKVLSAEGIIVGRVREIRIDPKSMDLQGILISRGIFQLPLYVGRSYFEKVSNDAAILNIDPFVLLKDKKVITFDGKVIGRIKEIFRYDETNDIKSIIVGTLFKKFNIPSENIKLIGKSVILKLSYDGAKKYIKQGS